MSKKKKKYGPKTAIEPARLQELLTLFDEDALESPGDAEVTALATHLTQLEDVDRLVALLHATPNRKSKKEVNKALFKLKQRGFEIPDLKDKPAAVQIAAGPVEVADLPVLMAKPDVDGQRDFLFAHAEGRELLAVEAQFLVPAGLARLTASKSNRTHYRKYTRGLATKKSPRMREPADYIVVSQMLRKRKLWEIGLCERTKKLGNAIDRPLLSSLASPEKPPPHPAWDLELEDARPLSLDELGQTDFVLRPFFHPSAHAKLKSQFEQWQDGGLIQSQSDEGSTPAKLDTAVGDWAEQWGFDTIAELCLDAALFYSAARLKNVALTLRNIVKAPRIEQRDRQIQAFLLDYVRWTFVSNETASRA